MERLSYKTLEKLGFEGYLMPEGTERVLQFGEGNFLRAFVDYFIDLANERTGWGTKVVAVQPIAQGRCEDINRQDGLYTVYLRGLENGGQVIRKRVVSSISRALNPYEDYGALLACAANPDLRYIVSNTTEAGIAFDENSRFDEEPPGSFPAKLTRFLYERYSCFKGEAGRGLVILSCELIDHNGDELKRCVGQYTELWKLEPEFADWLDREVIFCSTMVDRIVTGYPRAEAEVLNGQNGYEDLLLDTGEVFAIWVIEGPKELEDELPFKKAGLPVIVAEDCTPYKKRKVRMLNGVQTTMVLASYLSGQDIVRKCMEDPAIYSFMERCVYDEIIPVLTEYPKEELEDYAAGLFDRLCNPFIDHSLLAISLNTTSKWKARVLPTVREYQAATGKLPPRLMAGFAAYVMFYRGERLEGNALVAHRGDTEYRICDDMEVLRFFEAHKSDSLAELAGAVCRNAGFWDGDLTEIPGFLELVTEYLQLFEREGVHRVFELLGS